MAWYNAATNSFEGSGTLGARNYSSAASSSSNSAAQAIAQVSAFTGTNTGNRYNVGQAYAMNGDAYTAQADGTFRNTRTGQVVAGSSNSNTATFFASQSIVASGVGQTQPVGSGSATPQVTSGSGATVSGGPGNAGAVTTTQRGVGTGPGKPGAATATGSTLKSPFGAGPGGPRIFSGPSSIAPSRIILDTGMPNVEDFWEPRYGEVGEVLGGGVNVIADVKANDEAGEIDRMVSDALKRDIKIRPGSIADHVTKADWGRFQRDGFYLDQVQTFQDEAGWAPKW